MFKGLYIHVPFCVRKCRYCDFFSATDLSRAEDYTSAVIRNIAALDDSFDTVYFGGGTPSLLTAEQIYRILSAGNICQNAEISIECNPNSVNGEYFSAVRAVGVNRVSIGVQSFNDNELRLLGRLHTAEKAVSAVLAAEKAGFSGISVDLMLAVAEQNMESLGRNLEMVSLMPISHVSAYMLKIEDNTAIAEDRNFLGKIPDEDETAEMYLYTVDFLKRRGFGQYEISNFAKNGCECAHNLKYWRCEEYYGIGPAAHSFVNGERRRCPADLENFLSAPLQESVFLEVGGDPAERAMLSLRLTEEGLSLADFPKAAEPAEVLIKNGFLKKEQDCLRLTPKGCLVSNEIIVRLLGDVN